jgi:hypothetical protein
MKNVDFTPQGEQTIENPIKQGAICFLCLSFFPLMYFVGKMVISLF